MPDPIAAAAGQYRIAAVSQLTGIPVPTIRVWESRYGVVRPARSGGNTRLYSQADVERLLLLRATVDAGFQIGTVATLDDEQLRHRLAAEPRRVPSLAAGPERAVICGESLGARLATSWTGADAIAIGPVLADLESLAEAGGDGEPPPTFLIVDAATLDIGAVQALRRLRSRLKPQLTVVIYAYASRRSLRQLDDEGVVAVSAPCDPLHLARICRLGRGGESDGLSPLERLLREPAAPRRYSLPFLSQLCDLPTRVQCECPNHLAELLARLNAFEQYSLDCENRNAADAALHGRLHAAAAHCRVVLEQVLHQVLDAEGIEQPL